MVPEGWRRAPLRRLGKLLKGRGGSKADEVAEGVPVIRYGELYTRHHEVVREFASFVSPERAPDYTPLHIGDILFAGSGETLEEIGKSAVFLGPEPAHGSGDIIILRPDGRANPLFLGYATNGPDAVAQKARLGQGSSVMHIYTDGIAQVELLLPPLPEQKKIAAILSSVDDAIAATRKVIEQTERVKKGLLQTLMTRGIGHTRFKKTEIGEIPEGWDVARVGEVGLVQGGRQRSPDRSGRPRPYLRVANVFEGHIDTSDVLEMPFTDSEFETYRLAPGDILLNEGQSLELVGRSATYHGDPPECCFQNTLLRFRAGERVLQPFAQELFHYMLHSGRFQAVATQTTSVAHLGLRRFAGMAFALPPLDEQLRIAEVLEAVNLTRAWALGEHGAQCNLKTALLQSLLTGRVRVPVD